ncbi:MAG TPA: hypothetical protein VGO93_30605 [Candidatus Xenobia bacterium]|jgi:hypothetical protein
MKGVVVPRGDLTGAQVRSMRELLDAHFDGVHSDVFAHDLAAKDYVVLLEEDARLKGFSTMAVYPATFEETQVTVVFSGDTVVERSAWGSTALPRAWMAAVATFARERPVWWFLICSGWRTYRFLPLFFKRFWPSPGVDMPAELEAFRHRLAVDRFGAAWSPHEGIVRLSHPAVLRPGLGEVTPERAQDPYIDFFARLNPGWERGDELVCLTQFDRTNLTRIGQRLAPP